MHGWASSGALRKSRPAKLSGLAGALSPSADFLPSTNLAHFLDSLQSSDRTNMDDLRIREIVDQLQVIAKLHAQDQLEGCEDQRFQRDVFDA
jgi:hypothetical protein